MSDIVLSVGPAEIDGGQISWIITSQITVGGRSDCLQQRPKADLTNRHDGLGADYAVEQNKLYSITSSARASSVSGTVRPSASQPAANPLLAIALCAGQKQPTWGWAFTNRDRPFPACWSRKSVDLARSVEPAPLLR